MLTNQQAIANWETIADILAPAIPYTLGRITLDHIREMVDDELAAIVIAWDPQKGEVYAAFVCEIERYKTGRQCWKISLCGGRDVREWVQLWPVLKEMGRDQGCDQVEIVGRPGWFRLLQLSEVSRVHIEDL